MTDLLTGLLWQQRTADWVQDGAITERDKLTLADANSYLGVLNLGGKTGWRIPTIKEIQSLFDRTTLYPAMDPIFRDIRFEDGAYYWSSTNQVSAGQTFVGDFQFGDVNNIPAGNMAYLRAVWSQ